MPIIIGVVQYRFVFICLLFWLAPLLAADDGKPVVLVHPLERENMEIEESSFIESLLYSYITARDDVQVLLAEDAGDDQTAQYEMFGSLHNDDGNSTITLSVKDLQSGEIVSYTSAHKNSSEMVLKLRSIVQTLFQTAPSTANGEAASMEAEVITLNAVLGLWRADNGIEMVNFQRDGAAIAFFSSGERMSLKFTIEENVLKVIQNSPNRERYYQGLPHDIVRELTQKAQPLYFELRLYENGTALRGKRIETTAQASRDGEILLTHNRESPTDWKRPTR